MRTLAIGDIHGCCRALRELAAYVGFGVGDTIVGLGDYVDRGPDSKGVIDFLLRLRETRRLVYLQGNHEIMMLRAREDRGALLQWAGVGGDATLESYGAGSFDDVPVEHWEFIEGAAAFHETESHFFVHANVYPDVALGEQPDSMLFWEPFGDPPRHESGKTMICGHSSQKSGRPVSVGHAICIDTYCYGGGWLTCLDVDSGQYWQTNEAGGRRTGCISSCEPGR